MRNDYEEIPKHRKKKDSSTSKSNSKSKHKHSYSKECLLISDSADYPHYATYCRICGKINIVRFFESEKEDNGYYKVLDVEEVYEKYKKLEKIYVEDIWQKYVPISEGDV